MQTLEQIVSSFQSWCPVGDYWTLRVVDENTESLCVRQGVMQPVEMVKSRGVFITVLHGNSVGYGATSNVTLDGMKQAFSQARNWAKMSAGNTLIRNEFIEKNKSQGRYYTPVKTSWDSMTLNEKIDLLNDACSALKIDKRIVDWHASLGRQENQSILINSEGGRIEQIFHYVFPSLVAVANQGSQTQVRTGAGTGSGRQGGLEQITLLGFPDQAPHIAQQAIELLSAPECPCETMDLVLLPSQMVLQIHESIGHPLELDRILGDERNYAGTSFVTLEMLGQFKYGSSELNVTFNPTFPDQIATYGYDDEGVHAHKEYIIKDGVLLRSLGSSVSQARAGGIPGVANARACSWNRAPIDRMANLNVEPGNLRLEDLVSGIERGVMMDTNRSWSIDDSRNKFQFGCERAQLIENGELTEVVRNPNYRGISSNFWRSLDGVGDARTFEVSGVINCGKGEPNQSIYVGHAAPACRFRNIEVFGGG